MAEHIRFEEGLIGDGFSCAFGISTVDLTGNGFPDVVAMDTDVGLYWFENDGSGRFTRHVVHERAGEWLERHEIADIDGDGRPEIVSVDNSGRRATPGRLVREPRRSAAGAVAQARHRRALPAGVRSRRG